MSETYTFEVAVVWETPAPGKPNHETLEVLAPNALTALAMVLMESERRQPSSIGVKKLRRVMLADPDGKIPQLTWKKGR